MKIDNDKEKTYLEDETSPDYWDTKDSSELLESAEPVELQMVRQEIGCPKCGSDSLRARKIDLSVLSDTVVFRKCRVLYCSECRVSILAEGTQEELAKKLRALGAVVNTETFSDALVAGLTSYQKKWTEKANLRKSISVYFPRRDGSPAKAQISLSVTDQLYPVFRALTSEDVRTILGLGCFEDLEEAAKKQDRSISQYLKHEIKKKLGGKNDTSNTGEPEHDSLKTKEEDVGEDHPSKSNVFVLRPTKLHPNFFERKPHEPPYELAAESGEVEEKVYLGTSKNEFVGEVSYDYEKAELFLRVMKDDIGLKVFDLDLVLNDGDVKHKAAVQIKNGKILLLEDTKHFEEDVAEIVVKLH